MTVSSQTPPPLAPDLHFDPQWIVYEDDWLLAVNKPSGLLSVPGRYRPQSHCMSGQLAAHRPNIYTIHRLDMDTSGLMLFAKDPQTQKAMHRAFSERQVQKTYQAWCFGLPTQMQGTLQCPQRCDWPHRPKQIIDFRQGKTTFTHWQVTETASLNPQTHVFRVTLQPHTGRSHQLRLQMKTLGHPILGDNLYAPLSIQKMSDRLQLHAWQLSFTHPITQARCDWVQPPPPFIPKTP